jgi:apolipoprotein N-acyltransferase
MMWLVAGALLLGAGMRMQIPIAPWLALTFLLHGARTLPVLPGMTSVAVTLYATLAVAERGILPIPGPAYFGVIAALTLTATLPFVADRLAGVRLSGWAATLIFPMAWVAFEFLQSRFTPNATWGSLAYTQYGNLPLMQLAAVTGIWGITFLIAWFASVINAAVRPFVLGYAAILGFVLLAGAVRIALVPSGRSTLRAAAVSFPSGLFPPGEVTRILEGRVEGSEVGDKLACLHEWFLDRSRREARAGAKLVAWPETSLIVFQEDEAVFLERAARLAADEKIFLAMGVGTVQLHAAKPVENKAVLIDPSGSIAFSYRKSHPVAGWEARVMKPGDGRLPVVPTAEGRMAAAICYDGDFPEFIRAVGRARADIFFLPANDWAGIKRIHFEMAAFRAIENGVPLVRAASSGISGAFDAWGRVMGEADHFSGAATMVAQVPLGNVATVYPRTGDLFAWLCVAGLAVAAIVAVIAPQGRPHG